MAVITIDELIKRGLEKKEKDSKNITIFIQGQKMIFKKCDTATYLDVKEAENPDAELLYYTAVNPQLQNQELIEKLGCKSDPTKVIEKIFTFAETEVIAVQILKESGFFLGIKEKLEMTGELKQEKNYSEEEKA